MKFQQLFSFVLLLAGFINILIGLNLYWHNQSAWGFSVGEMGKVSEGRIDFIGAISIGMALIGVALLLNVSNRKK